MVGIGARDEAILLFAQGTIGAEKRIFNDTWESEELFKKVCLPPGTTSSTYNTYL